jgi:hypothetical protein
MTTRARLTAVGMTVEKVTLMPKGFSFHHRAHAGGHRRKFEREF